MAIAVVKRHFLFQRSVDANFVVTGQLMLPIATTFRFRIRSPASDMYASTVREPIQQDELRMVRFLN